MSPKGYPVCLLGMEINVMKNTHLQSNIEKVVNYLQENLQDTKGKYICISNVHTTVMAYEDYKYMQVQNNSIMSLPDGKPLQIISKIRGYKNAERVTGPDLMEAIFQLSEKKGFTHYFYGSTEETLQKLVNNLQKKYPKIKIVGTCSPPFRTLTKEEDRNIIQEINDKNPDFVWVRLGAPKQEIWMFEHRQVIKSLMIGVGAGFDYHAENIRRAPIFMQNHHKF